jgi:hypothetical protein
MASSPEIAIFKAILRFHQADNIFKERKDGTLECASSEQFLYYLAKVHHLRVTLTDSYPRDEDRLFWPYLQKQLGEEAIKILRVALTFTFDITPLAKSYAYRVYKRHFRNTFTPRDNTTLPVVSPIPELKSPEMLPEHPASPSPLIIHFEDHPAAHSKFKAPKGTKGFSGCRHFDLEDGL